MSTVKNRALTAILNKVVMECVVTLNVKNVILIVADGDEIIASSNDITENEDAQRILKVVLAVLEKKAH